MKFGNEYNGNQSYANKSNQKGGISTKSSYRANSVRDSSMTIKGPSSEKTNASIDRSRGGYIEK